MRVVASFAVALALSVTLSACGGDEELLPGNDAQEIVANLERVEEFVATGECDAAEDAIDEVADQIANLPSRVSDRLRRNLMDGIDRLREVTEDSCPDHEIDDDAEEPADPIDEEIDEADDDNGENGDDDTDDRDENGDRGQNGREPGTGRTPAPSRPDPPGRGRGTQPTPTPPPPAPDDTGGVAPGEDLSGGEEGQ